MSGNLHSAVPAAPTTGALRPLAIAAVRLADGFWGKRQRLNSDAIIPHALGWVERLGWTGNLRSAASNRRATAGGLPYEHRGREFADSEIFKLIEALSWEQAGDRTDLAEGLGQLVDLVIGAQDPDGYLHTRYGRHWQRPRYSDFQWGHELYCFGHLIQAAVAHHRASGDKRLLDTATRLADHVCGMFGEDGLRRVCGHPGIEPALVELYRVTGDARYLRQASVFLNRRGTGTLPLLEFGAAYWQDDLPVREATVLRGHAVRALYLAMGAVDVAVETGDTALLAQLELQWENTVARRTYLTGGMGSHHMDEAFGDDFVLPPDRSYCETCAGVAAIMWSWRLLLATGKARYADLIERILFNVVATSPGADGKSFFYANTLHQRVESTPPALNDDGVVIRGGASGRQPWFEVSCCPPNLARLLASLGGYVATGDDSGVQIHQLTSCQITSGPIVVEVDTAYPAEGWVRVTLRQAGPQSRVRVAIRVPAWADDARIRHAGRTEAVGAGYASVELKVGESFDLDLSPQVRVTWPDDRIDAIRGTAAVERGPEVFALESVDLPEGWRLADARLLADSAEYDHGQVLARLERCGHPDGAWPYSLATQITGQRERVTVPLVRYHEWAQRGPSTMRVWIPLASQQVHTPIEKDF